MGSGDLLLPLRFWFDRLPARFQADAGSAFDASPSSVADSSAVERRRFSPFDLADAEARPSAPPGSSVRFSLEPLNRPPGSITNSAVWTSPVTLPPAMISSRRARIVPSTVPLTMTLVASIWPCTCPSAPTTTPAFEPTSPSILPSTWRSSASSRSPTSWVPAEMMVDPLCEPWFAPSLPKIATEPAPPVRKPFGTARTTSP